MGERWHDRCLARSMPGTIDARVVDHDAANATREAHAVDVRGAHRGHAVVLLRSRGGRRAVLCGWTLRDRWVRGQPEGLLVRQRRLRELLRTAPGKHRGDRRGASQQRRGGVRCRGGSWRQRWVRGRGLRGGSGSAILVGSLCATGAACGAGLDIGGLRGWARRGFPSVWMHGGGMTAGERERSAGRRWLRGDAGVCAETERTTGARWRLSSSCTAGWNDGGTTVAERRPAPGGRMTAAG